jgi:hypothetical protein
VATAVLVLAVPWVAQAATAWTYQAVSLSAGVAHGGLHTVSCAGSDSCMALLYYYNSASVPLAQYWDGTSWAVSATARPPGAVSEYGLSGVSCPAPGSCTAVGWYQTTSGDQWPLAEHWDGTSWAVQPTAVPAGATFAGLASVSCPSAGDCMAVGETSHPSSRWLHTLAEQWDGTSWTIDPTPTLRKEDSILLGVSCAAPDSCLAIGSPVQSWDGTSWTRQPSPATPMGMSAVSCPAVDNCTAVGSAGDGDTIAPAAAHWDGTA